MISLPMVSRPIDFYLSFIWIVAYMIGIICVCWAFIRVYPIILPILLSLFGYLILIMKDDLVRQLERQANDERNRA